MSYHPTDQSDEQHYASKWDEMAAKLRKAGYHLDRSGFIERTEFDLDSEGDPGINSLAELESIEAITRLYDWEAFFSCGDLIELVYTRRDD